VLGAWDVVAIYFQVTQELGITLLPLVKLAFNTEVDF